MTTADERAENRRKLGKWLLVVFVGWIGLTFVEGQITNQLDRSIRADSSIFQDYIEQLPDKLGFPKYKDWRVMCETYKAGYLWTYQICLSETRFNESTASWGGNTFPCPSPYFTVGYYPPRRYLAVFKSERWRSPYLITQDKKICETHNL